MSRTMKDKANHFAHHKIPDSPRIMQKSKYRYTPLDIPADVKDLVQILEVSYRAGMRYGNNRKRIADEKIKQRRRERHAANKNLRKDLDD